MTLQVKGNFRRYDSVCCKLDRQIQYQNLCPESAISEIFLWGHNDGRLELFLTPRNYDRTNFQTLSSVLCKTSELRCAESYSGSINHSVDLRCPTRTLRVLKLASQISPIDDRVLTSLQEHLVSSGASEDLPSLENLALQEIVYNDEVYREVVNAGQCPPLVKDEIKERYRSLQGS